MYYLILFDFKSWNIGKGPHKEWSENGGGLLEHPLYEKIKSLACQNEHFGDGDNFSHYGDSCFPVITLLYNDKLTAKEIYKELSSCIVEGTDEVRGDELYVIEINPYNTEGYGPAWFSMMIGAAERLLKDKTNERKEKGNKV